MKCPRCGFTDVRWIWWAGVELPQCDACHWWSTNIDDWDEVEDGS